jgi:CheY-like chemotaxis protein
MKIRDTGIGIPKDKLHRLYTPFDRLDVDVGKYEGSGLGLSIVHKIVMEYNGKIICGSEYGNNTTFMVELNIIEKNVDDSNHVDIVIENVSIINNLKILYIEDNKMNYTLITNILNKKFGNGVELTISQNGNDGITSIKNNVYDLILLDYMLPDINGDVVLENILSKKYVTDLKNVVLTTTLLDPVVTSKLQTFGVTKFLYKPIDVKKFFSYLDECVNDNVKRSI